MSRSQRLSAGDRVQERAREVRILQILDLPDGTTERGALVELTAAELGLSVNRVYELVRDYVARGELAVRRKRREDVGRRRAISLEDQDAWLGYATHTNRLHWPASVRARRYREFLQKAHGRTLDCSDGTLLRILRDAQRDGRVMMTPKEAKRQFKRQVRLNEAEANRVWQWDQHTADVEVLGADGTPYRPIGLWLVDRFSGVMMGGRYFRYYDTDAVEGALLDAIYPSEDGVLPYHGTPEIIHGDNGKQFTSRWAKRILRLLGIHLSTGIPNEPTGHGYVESFHGLVGQFERMCPRYLGPDAKQETKPLPYRIVEQGGRAPGWEEYLTLDQLNARLRVWLAEQMHQPYKGGESRDARWWRTIRPERRAVPDPAALAWESMPKAEVMIRGGIIQFQTIQYTAEHLGALNGERVEVRYLRGDVTKLWVVLHGELYALAKPLHEHAYLSASSRRDLKKRNSEFRDWQRDARATADLGRAAAKLIDAAEAQELLAASDRIEQLSRDIRPEQHDELQQALASGDNVVPFLPRPERLDLQTDQPDRPSVSLDDLETPAEQPLRTAQSDWV